MVFMCAPYLNFIEFWKVTRVRRLADLLYERATKSLDDPKSTRC